ncbi:hypothetical protein [Actinoplanes italicus]|uniref:hypothetical protein n=1 Tax=Actinoplanes italicus TaxID=113567 RepID=UPI0011B1CC68|nr:hypothetical protein [Actinoplanes italicus]
MAAGLELDTTVAGLRLEPEVGDAVAESPGVADRATGATGKARLWLFPLAAPIHSWNFGLIVQFHVPPASSAPVKVTDSVAFPDATTVRAMSGLVEAPV